MTATEAFVEVLKRAFAECWSQDTSSDPENWTPENPSYGHCALAAMAAKTVLGGEMLRYDLKGTPYENLGSHYKNRLPDDTIVDFTEAQFQGCPPVWGEPIVRMHHELLDPDINPKNRETRKRYALFSQRVIDYLDSFKKHSGA